MGDNKNKGTKLMNIKESTFDLIKQLNNRVQGKHYIHNNINALYESAMNLGYISNPDNYMYMYSINNVHCFKNRDTRRSFNIELITRGKPLMLLDNKTLNFLNKREKRYFNQKELNQ